MSRPNKRHSAEDANAYKTGSSSTKYRDRRDRSTSPHPPSTKHYKTSSSDLNSKKKAPPAPELPRKQGIQIKLNQAKPAVPMKPKITVASAFNQDSDSEPEEMPPEARMRMRNIGRDTPTSAGPNSFGKTKHGFCDAKKVFEKSLKEAMNQASQSDD